MKQFAKTVFMAMAMLFTVIVTMSVGANDSTTDEAVGGRFEGDAELERLDDDPFVPRFRVISELRFEQASGEVWLTPADSIVDGRSVPLMFIQLAGNLFDRKFRKTAITYDYAVQSKYHSWKKVHRMFYDGTLTEGVQPLEAKVMYLLLSASGSRWAPHGPDSCFSRCHNGAEELEWRPRVDEEKLASLLNWVRTENPSLEAIDQRASAAIIEKGPHIFGTVR